MSNFKEEVSMKNVKTEPQWIDDKEVTHCSSCSKEFNLTRRKVLLFFFFFQFDLPAVILKYGVSLSIEYFFIASLSKLWRYFLFRVFGQCHGFAIYHESCTRMRQLLSFVVGAVHCRRTKVSSVYHSFPRILRYEQVVGTRNLLGFNF